MRSFKIGFQAVFFLVISAGILTGGCVNTSVFSESPANNLSMNSDDIQAEINRLEEISKNEAQSATDPRLFLDLCLLYSNPNNEQPDYRNSQKRLETYLSFHQDASMPQDVLYLSSLLMHINQLKDEQDTLTAQYDRLKKDEESLQRDTTTLKGKNGHLISQNKNLENIIERLKQLDILLEEKRNTF